MKPNPRVDAQMRAALEAGLRAAADHLLEAADRRVPIDDDRTLQRSGTVSQDGLEAAVSYDTDYAVKQHEALYLRHDPGRTAKWLEIAGIEEYDRMGEIIAETVRSRT